MKILIDMNLSPDWVPLLRKSGIEAIHWSKTGNHRAPDHEIMEWARLNEYIVFTHDLDFGAILAATGTHSPSVIQIRTQDVSPSLLEKHVLHILQHYKDHLKKGALVTLDEDKSRIRILPIHSVVKPK